MKTTGENTIPKASIIDNGTIIELFPQSRREFQSQRHLVSAVANGYGQIEFEFPAEVTGMLEQLETMMSVSVEVHRQIEAIGSDYLALDRDEAGVAQPEDREAENDKYAHQQAAPNGLTYRYYLGFTKVVPKAVRYPAGLGAVVYVLWSIVDDVHRLLLS